MNKEELLKEVDELLVEISSHEMLDTAEDERNYINNMDLKIRNLRNCIDLLDLKERLENSSNL